MRQVMFLKGTLQMSNFNFGLVLLNFIVGLAPTMEALMEAQEGLYSKAEVLETAFLQVLEKEGVYNSSVQEVDLAWVQARKEFQRLEQEEEEAFRALLGIFSEVPAVSLVSRLHEAQEAVEKAREGYFKAVGRQAGDQALSSLWRAEKTLRGLEAQVLEFPGDDPVLFEAKVRLKAATV